MNNIFSKFHTFIRENEKNYDTYCIQAPYAPLKDANKYGVFGYQCQYCSNLYMDDYNYNYSETEKKKLIDYGLMTPENVCRKCLWNHKDLEDRKETKKLLKELISTLETLQINIDMNPEKKQCAICYENIGINKFEILKCKHSFCKDCINIVKKSDNPVCPLCRTKF